MPFKVAALYQFAALPDFRELREPLRALAADLGIKGSVLLAREGINGTIAGDDQEIDAFVQELQHGPLFGGRLDNLELKFSTATEMPFQRLKVRLKKEIVTLSKWRATLRIPASTSSSPPNAKIQVKKRSHAMTFPRSSEAVAPLPLNSRPPTTARSSATSFPSALHL